MDGDGGDHARARCRTRHTTTTAAAAAAVNAEELSKKKTNRPPLNRADGRHS